MRKYVLGIIVLIVFALGVTVALFVQSSRRVAALEEERSKLQARLQPLEEKQRAVLRINQEFVVSPGTIQSYRFSPDVVPGTLTGTWSASGRGWGGVDDTIAAFRLTDPKDRLLESSQRASSGRFLVKLSAPGTYTFFFDNGGMFRSTPRRVFLDAEFRPD